MLSNMTTMDSCDDNATGRYLSGWRRCRQLSVHAKTADAQEEGDVIGMYL